MENINAKEHQTIYHVPLHVRKYLLKLILKFSEKFVLTGLAIAKFSFPPASEYICYYSVGKFAPEAIPKCLYGK